MTNGQQISITLSPAQIDQVLRAISKDSAPSIASMIASADVTSLALDDDRRLSRSLLRGLQIFVCFKHDGEERGIVDLAHELDMSPSTTHRYVTTLVELGLLEQCPRSRKYRLPSS